MSDPKSRRWEKPTKAAAAQAPVPPTPTGQLNAFVDGLTESEKASHRAAYLHLLQSMAGCNVNVECVDGKKLTGVFHTATPFEGKAHIFVLKGTRVTQDNAPVGNGANDGKTACLPYGQIATVATSSKIDLVSKTYSSEFQTDSAIKKHGDMTHLSGRNLQSLDSSWLETSGDVSLESNKTGKTWDQFEVNKRLFNVKDTYDENLYTKRLDLKSMTAEQIARADRLAREIEGSVSSNIHLQEERGQVTEGDWDEEDRFSGVLRGAEGGSEKGPKKTGKTAVADIDNAWKRGGRLGGGSSAASPVTPAGVTTPATAAAGAAAAKGKPAPVTPPPGMSTSPKKTAPPAAAVTEAAAPAAVAKEVEPVIAVAVPVAVETKTDTASADVSPAAATPATTTAPATAATAGEAAPAAEVPKPVASKLRVTAAEFKPSWMANESKAPATPVQQNPVPPVQAFVPHNFAHMPYPVPMTPDGNMPPQMYNKVHNSPGQHPMGASSPNTQPMHEIPSPYYENPAMGMMALPPQHGFPPVDYPPPPMNPGFIFPPGQMMPMSPMGMVPMPGMPGMQMQGMPMEFQNPNMMPMGQMNQMGQMMHFSPPQQQFYGDIGMMNGQPMMQQQYGGYNQGFQGGPQPGMGFAQNGMMNSGQKMPYDKGMRGPNNKMGGRGMGSGMKPGGYNNNMGRGAGMNNSNNMVNNGPGTPVANSAPRSEDGGAEA